MGLFTSCERKGLRKMGPDPVLSSTEENEVVKIVEKKDENTL